MIRVLGYVHSYVPAQHKWAAVAFAAAAASLAWTPDPLAASGKLAGLAIAYILGTWLVPSLPWVIYGVLVCLAAVACFWVKINPTVLATAAMLGFAGAVVYRLWPLALANLGILLLWPARGPALALVAFAIAWAWCQRRILALTIATGLLLIAATIYAFKSSEGGASVYQRLGIWQDTLDHLSIRGGGFGSFEALYASWPVHRNAIGNIVERAGYAYSDPLQLVFELGVGAIAVWFVVLYAVAQGTREFRLIALTFGVLAIAYFPLSIPGVGHIFMFALGGAEDDKWQDDR